jgi:hypothetical protein
MILYTNENCFNKFCLKNGFYTLKSPKILVRYDYPDKLVIEQEEVKSMEENKLQVKFALVEGVIEMSQDMYERFVQVSDNTMQLDLKKDFEVRLSPRSLRIQSISEQKRKRQRREAVKHAVEGKEIMPFAQTIADKFSREFLGKRRLDLKTKPRWRKDFIDIARKILDFSKEYDLPEETVTKYVFRSAERTFRDQGQIISPGVLHSQWIWDIVLPQHLTEVCPGFVLRKSKKSTEVRRSKSEEFTK